MTTRKLLWGATWRGAVWGYRTGGVLGGAYIVLTLLVSTILASPPGFQFSFQRDMTAVVIITMIGFIFGVVVGGLIGFTGGMVIAALILLLESLHASQKRYSIVIGLIMSIYASLGFGLIVGLLVGIPLQWNRFVDCYESGCNLLSLYIIGVPLLISGFGGFYVSRHVVHWYENDTQKNVP